MTISECIDSVLSQSFSDFEVIVGNDYPLLRISHELLGISDPRARFLNYAENLGELGNMRHLLEQSRGHYFTWLADDDTYAREFLALAYAVLKSQNFPPVLFTGYSIGQTPPKVESEGLSSRVLVLSGRRFLNGYLKRSFKVIGCYGLFDTNYLRKIGGMERLGNGFSPYSDNLLAIR
ncbi:MAG: glycosyltransferase family 2 protein [Syntrophorhabdus sp.]|nr:glycosyltransferase family 2 protein [Syntrophorhabdus sp.]